MPVTPFHLGLGGIAGGYTSSWFSFRAFCFANVLIDIEALYRIPLGLFPLHYWMHTFIFAVAAPLILWFPIGKPFCLWVSRCWNTLAKGGLLERIYIPNSIQFTPAAIALFLGGLSHVLLDAVMHSDMMPLQPFSSANPFYQFINVDTLHWILIFCGLIGISLLFFRTRKYPK